MNETLRTAITQQYREENAGGQLFYLFDHIPADKLRNATRAYAPGFRQDETVIFLYDDTVRENGKDGFLLTTRALYQKNMWERAKSAEIPYIMGMSIDHGALMSTINVRAESGALEMYVTTMPRDQRPAMFRTLEYAVRLLQNPEEAIPAGGAAAQGADVLSGCRNCGAHHPAGTRFCEYCGAALS